MTSSDQAGQSDARFAQFSISPSSTLTRREAAAAAVTAGAAPMTAMVPTFEDCEGAVGGFSSGSPESPRLARTIGDEVRLRVHRRNQFRLSRKTAISMDQCHVWGTMPVLPMHSHSGSDTGLTLGIPTRPVPIPGLAFSAESVQKRQSVAESSSHLRVLHDSLTSLTSRITGSQESLPSADTQSLVTGFGKASRNRRKLKDNRERLAEQLRQLEVSGLPRLESPHLDTPPSLELESSWDKVVSESNISSSKMIRQQAAIWELFQTEINILRHLRTIIEVYISVIRHLQSANSGLLTEVSTERLFPGVGLVYRAHLRLWTDHLRPALLLARSTGDPVRPTHLATGFLHFGDIFHPCAEYCLQIPDAKEYLRGLEKSEAFVEFAKWAQRMSCRNYNTEDGSVDLQLQSLLTMPLQRITKYGLLLQEVLRHTEELDERQALETMILHTSEFCNRLNASYQLKSDQEEVRVVAERLEDAKLQEWRETLGDEAASLLDRYRLDLTRPMPHNGLQRRKLCEGELRMRDEKGKWSDFKCLLFSDLVLLTKCGKRSNLRLLRPPVPLDRTLIHRVPDSSAFLLVLLTDFGSVECLLYLAGQDQRVSDDWVERMAAAKAALAHQAARLSVSSCCCFLENHHLSSEQLAVLAAQPPPLIQQTADVAAATTAISASTLGNPWQNQQQRSQRPLHYTHSSSEIDALGRAAAGRQAPSQTVTVAANSTGTAGSRLQTEHDVYTLRTAPAAAFAAAGASPTSLHRLRPA